MKKVVVVASICLVLYLLISCAAIVFLSPEGFQGIFSKKTDPVPTATPVPIFTSAPAPTVTPVVTSAPVVVTPQPTTAPASPVANQYYDYLIIDIQKALVRAGYNISITGERDEATIRSVMDCQTAYGLERDGIVGPRTAAVLGVFLPDEVLTPEKYVSDTNYLLIVSTRNKVLTLLEKTYYGNNAYEWTKSGTWACTVGNSATPTPQGTFKIETKSPGFWKDNLEYRYFSTFYGEYGFHSTGFDTAGYTDTSVLGLKLSHGCVRLEEYVAKWIYENVPYGTTVVVK